MSLFWELGQQSRIHEAEARVADAKADVAELRRDVQTLEGAVERLLLINRAMWELLGSHASLKEADLVARVREIDLRDGKADGRLRTAVRQCSACGRTLQKKHARCLYCGAQEAGTDPFRAP